MSLLEFACCYFSVSANQESHKAEVVHLKQVTAEMESSTASKPASPAVR